MVMEDFNYPEICWKINSAKRIKSNRHLMFLGGDSLIFQKVEQEVKHP